MTLKTQVVAGVIAFPVFAVVVALPFYLAYLAHLTAAWWGSLIVIVVLLVGYRALLPRIFVVVGQYLRRSGRA
ncbi:MAG: hypothetical protein JWQ32_595 [Marmoricola sp.]|nr:hypothetical protein [Marmoricola sp.]